MLLNEKNIFLFDALGALISATALGLVLPKLSNLIGLPNNVLYFLSLCAVFFFIYSLNCFFFCDHKNSKWLKFISFLNTAYCFVTAFCVSFFWKNIMWPGVLYFTLEIIVIALVVYTERKIYKSLDA